MTIRWAPVAALIIALGLPTRRAHADNGDWTATVAATWLPLRSGRVGGVVERGLADSLALSAELGLGLGPMGWQGTASIGPTLVWDVLKWVPAATLAVGVGNRGARWYPRAGLNVDMRRFVTPHAGFSLGLLGEWWIGANPGLIGGARLMWFTIF